MPDATTLALLLIVGALLTLIAYCLLLPNGGWKRDRP